MLLREDLRGDHERPLVAVLDRDQQGEQRDDRLPRADVPLEQAIHGVRRPQVRADLPQHLLLRLGELEREEARELRPERVGHLVRDPAGLFLETVPLHRQRELEQEDLLESERSLGRRRPAGELRETRVGGREVDLPERPRALEQPVARGDRLRHGAGERPLELLQRPVHQIPLHSRREVRELAVHRDDPAGVDPLRVVRLEELVVRVLEDHVAAVPVERRPAEHHGPPSLDEEALEVGLVVPDRANRAALVLELGLEDREAGAARPDQAAPRDAYREGRLGAARNEGRDPGERTPVLVAKRQDVEKVLDRLEAGLAEALRAPRADALEVPELGVGLQHRCDYREGSAVTSRSCLVARTIPAPIRAAPA